MPPLTSKGAEIRRAMEREYGKKKGESVFYASRNKGTISGVDARGATDELRRAIAAGNAEAEHQRQAERLMSGAHVSGRDRTKLRR